MCESANRKSANFCKINPQKANICVSPLTANLQFVYDRTKKIIHLQYFKKFGPFLANSPQIRPQAVWSNFSIMYKIELEPFERILLEKIYIVGDSSP